MSWKALLSFIVVDVVVDVVVVIIVVVIIIVTIIIDIVSLVLLCLFVLCLRSQSAMITVFMIYPGCILAHWRVLAHGLANISTYCIVGLGKYFALSHLVVLQLSLVCAIMQFPLCSLYVSLCLVCVQTCSKQYKNAAEMEAHMSSYDHHHKKVCATRSLPLLHAGHFQHLLACMLSLFNLCYAICFSDNCSPCWQHVHHHNRNSVYNQLKLPSHKH